MRLHWNVVSKAIRRPCSLKANSMWIQFQAFIYVSVPTKNNGWLERFLVAYCSTIVQVRKLHRNWPEYVRESSKIMLESAVVIILANIILLPNTFLISSFNTTELITGQGSKHSYAFATLENETSASTSSSSVNMDTAPGSIEYNARYFCGTIVGQDGPLRPGRYNSDINIFNRQQSPISFLWKAVPSSNLPPSQIVDGSSNGSNPFATDTNYKLQTLAPGESISLSCKDFVPSVSLYSNSTDGVDRFIEGVSTISVDLDPLIQAAISSSSTGVVVSQPSGEATNEPSTNVLSVDAIYTVNALEVPSREIILQLVEYTINQQDVNGKLPAEIISKPLSVTVPIRTNETINPDTQVKEILAREYSLNATEMQNLDITIRNLSLGVGALDDNHAISLQRINAYQPAPPSAGPTPSIGNFTSP